MILKPDNGYWTRYIVVTICLAGAFLCFKIGLDLSWGFCIGVFAPLFLVTVVLDGIAAGRTVVMDAQGITVSLWRFQKTYRWDEFQTKRQEEYAALTWFRSYGNCPYHKGAMFAPYRVRKPRWIGRPAYATFHPWCYIYVNFYVPPPKHSTALFPDWRGRCYEVKEEEFQEKMRLWQVKLDEYP